ncbi:hypothetical protein TNCV_4709601 [Trichonephila clavipes]|nr:hypothetical protein TNCV_4709601 [Trichonephila clavipes]
MRSRKTISLAGPSNVVLKHRVDSIGPERLFSLNERTLAERSKLVIPEKGGPSHRLDPLSNFFYKIETPMLSSKDTLTRDSIRPRFPNTIVVVQQVLYRNHSDKKMRLIHYLLKNIYNELQATILTDPWVGWLR